MPKKTLSQASRLSKTPAPSRSRTDRGAEALLDRFLQMDKLPSDATRPDSSPCHPVFPISDFRNVSQLEFEISRSELGVQVPAT